MRAILRGFETIFNDFGHFRVAFSDFRLDACGFAGLLVRGVTGGRLPVA